MLAEERERRALAQDLHDDLGQILAVINLKIKTLEKQKMSASLRREFDACAAVVDQANRKLRSMAFQLNPPLLHDLGLVAALEWIADEMHQMYRLDVSIMSDGTATKLEQAVSATLFRAVRELLINVAKHARVEKAVVGIDHGQADTLRVTVSDSGAGFDPDAVRSAGGSAGFGLISVRERLGFLSGKVSIRSNPGNGTSVILEVPLQAAAAAAASVQGNKP